MTFAKEIRTVLAEEALQAFWKAVARHFPHAKSGDLSWDSVIALQTAAEQAIEEWIENNVPGTSS